MTLDVTRVIKGKVLGDKILMNNMATDKSGIMTYVPPEIKKRLEALAMEQRRSLSNFVEILLIEYVEGLEKKGSDRNS
jgi:hypothetical protein